MEDIDISDEMSQTVRSIKITVVGEGAVGKTCMLISYIDQAFPTEYVPTVFDNYSGNLSVDGQRYNISLWDTAGQEGYERLRALSYPRTDCILLCYSVANRSSKENIINKWYPEVHHHVPEAPIILVATKIDLRTVDSEFVSTFEGIQLKRRIKAAALMECSARTREGLNEVFDKAVRTVVSPKKKSLGLICRLL